ncbi:hypothetical protein [Iningainema tapete]|uniref:Calcium-binding protein n=1 Tax=Iningainema tapete BLCC-T55 TaxID=2748662 RepID=A0A8J7BZM1_9CYAN|nr:hypothetical protein [Iningainema tapete]MBD2776193.1 hypothetical protein [Iningainema tapete BLCC-T55]
MATLLPGGSANADVLNGTRGNDLIIALAGDDNVFGNDGNDIIFGGAGEDILLGEAGNDIIDGGAGNDFLDAGAGINRLTGGAGNDIFFFSDAPFAGTTANAPDVLTDYQIGQDRLLFSSDVLGINALNFQAGNSGQLSGDSNLLVLLDPFPNAGAAAAAIAANDAVTADAGLFVYFNFNLGFSRVVFSQDLSDNGRISVLGNLINITDPASQALYTAQDFTLV